MLNSFHSFSISVGSFIFCCNFTWQPLPVVAMLEIYLYIFNVIVEFISFWYIILAFVSSLLPLFLLSFGFLRNIVLLSSAYNNNYFFCHFSCFFPLVFWICCFSSLLSWIVSNKESAVILNLIVLYIVYLIIVFLMCLLLILSNIIICILM